MNDWLPFDRFISQEHAATSTENSSAKVVANSAEVSLDTNTESVASAEPMTDEGAFQFKNLFNWKKENASSDSIAGTSRVVSDPFLNDEVDLRSSQQDKNVATALAVDGDAGGVADVELLSAPGDDDRLVANSEDANAGFDAASLIESVSDGSGDGQNQKPVKQDSALERLQDLLAEDDLLLDDTAAVATSSGNRDLTERRLSNLQLKIEEMLRVAQGMFDDGAIEDAYAVCLRAKRLADDADERLLFDVISPDELLEEIEERRSDLTAELSMTRETRKIESDFVESAMRQPSSEIERQSTNGSAKNDKIEASRVNSQKQDLLRNRIEEMLAKAQLNLDNGLVDEAWRICKQARGLADSASPPLTFAVISPDDLAARIAHIQKNLIERNTASKHESLIPTEETQKPQLRSGAKWMREKDDLVIGKTDAAKRELTNAHNSNSIRHNPARVWEVEPTITHSSNTNGQALTLNDAPQGAEPRLLDTPEFERSSEQFPRVVVNGSVRLQDQDVAPTSHTVPLEEKQIANEKTPAFVSRDWSQWESDVEMNDDLASSDSTDHERRPSGEGDVFRTMSERTGDSVTPTRLPSIDWDANERDVATVDERDDAQWKMMLGLTCLLAGLSLMSLLRHPRRKIPTAVPVYPQSRSTTSEQSVS